MLKGVNRLLLITVSNWMSSKINSLRTVNINIYIYYINLIKNIFVRKK